MAEIDFTDDRDGCFFMAAGDTIENRWNKRSRWYFILKRASSKKTGSWELLE